jgi:transcriptional regulator NrdR family protein
MLCPSCKNMNSPKKVLKTITLDNGNVKRRRRCSKCKTIYSTIEVALTGPKMLLDGVRSVFL